METPGEFLRKKREGQGASLDEVAARINLRVEFVRNLEADLYNFAPAPVYIVGALTAYARALGVDVEEVLARYHEMTGAGERERGETITEPEPPRRGLPFGWKPVAGGAALVVLIAILVIFGRRDSSPRSSDVPPPLPAYEPRAETLAVAISPPPMPAPERVVLEMSVEESTWVALEMDGERRYSALLGPGAYRRWEADSTFAIKIGNAGGVTLTLDGEPVEFRRQRGRVVLLNLPEREGRDLFDPFYTLSPDTTPAVETDEAAVDFE